MPLAKHFKLINKHLYYNFDSNYIIIIMMQMVKINSIILSIICDCLSIEKFTPKSFKIKSKKEQAHNEY